MYTQHGRMPKHAAFITKALKDRLASRIYTAVETLNNLERHRGRYSTSSLLESQINDAHERLLRVTDQYNRQFPNNPWAPNDASPPANPRKERI